MPDKSNGFNSMFNIIFIVAGIIALAPTLQRILATTPLAQFYAAQAYQGDVETRVLNANQVLRYWDLINDSPYTPLISAFFINRGPNRIYIGINAARDWLEIWPGETRTVSHIGADKRIEIIFYKCNPGESALVEVEGHF